MKKLVMIMAVVFAIGGSAFGQSKPGEGWYDSGDGKANAPGSSSSNRSDRHDGPQEVDLPDREETVVVDITTDPENLHNAIERAKEKLIATGAKALAVLGVKYISGAGPAAVFRIAVGVAFPATRIADGERRAPSPPQVSKPRLREKDEAPHRF